MNSYGFRFIQIKEIKAWVFCSPDHFSRIIKILQLIVCLTLIVFFLIFFLFLDRIYRIFKQQAFFLFPQQSKIEFLVCIQEVGQIKLVPHNEQSFACFFLFLFFFEDSFRSFQLDAINKRQQYWIIVQVVQIYETEIRFMHRVQEQKSNLENPGWK